jgi:hypothetical protein
LEDLVEEAREEKKRWTLVEALTRLVGVNRVGGETYVAIIVD